MFTLLILKLIFLYFLIFLGYVAGRWLRVEKESVARLLIYLIVPMVFFTSILNMNLHPSLLLLPILFYALACTIALCMIKFSKFFCVPPATHILAFATGSGNIGYFGFPLVVAVMGEEYLGVAALIAIGFILFENSLGFYLTARGRHTVSKSLKKVATLPTVYAFLLAVVLRFLGYGLPSFAKEFALNLRGAYSILGMMMIGIAISHIRKPKLNFRFLCLSFFGKFMLWPLLISLLIWGDQKWFQIFSPDIHRMMFLMSIVPLPGNSVAVATELNTEPEQTAIAVLLSTVFAFGYIPLMLAIF